MGGDIACQKAQELAGYRVVIGGLGLRQHDLTTGADRVLDPVALARLEGTAHVFGTVVW